MAARRSPRRSSGRRPGTERLDLPIETHAHPGQHAEGKIMPLEALEVSGHRLPDAACPDGHDRHGEGQDRWLLGRARDDVAGERHQADAEEHRERAERDGRNHARTWQPRDPE
jgi:hypothetical protein